MVRIWDARSPSRRCEASLKGHTGTITAVRAEPSSGFSQIFTASSDKTLRIWSLSMRSFVDWQFGHTSGVTCMDVLVNDRPITGGEDGTIRAWKVAAGTHFLYPQQDGPIDACAALTQRLFASGSQNGNLALWNANRRKPLCEVTGAHGGRWITSLAPIGFSDVLFSGSDDGLVRCWKASSSSDKHKQRGDLSPVATIPVAGVVNSMCVSRSGRFLFGAIGREHRLGRWVHHNSAKMGLMVVKVQE